LGNLKVRILPSILLVLCAPAVSLARPVSTPPKHPAVVRVVVPEGRSMSLGSGALVAVSEDYGLVVTNWHVVRDGHAAATVVFPDGFRSAATVVRVDRDWDLAALVIWRPRVQPIPLAPRRPGIGEPLWIAGYGRGSYRIVPGRCTHYLSPGGRLPFDMIELSAGARQGDSGGPILNQRGELAGVLFGAAWGKTSGSHCLRVRQFLDPVLDRFDSVPPDDPTRIARREAPSRRTPTVTIRSAEGTAHQRAGAATARTRPGTIRPGANRSPWRSSSPMASPFVSPPDPQSDSAASPGGLVPSDPWEQAKTVLAIIGLLAICFHVLRWIAA